MKYVESELTLNERIEEIKELRRKQYNIREGQRVNILKSTSEADCKKCKKYKVSIEGIYEYFVVLKYPAGYCEAMDWDDFFKCVCG